MTATRKYSSQNDRSKMLRIFFVFGFILALWVTIPLMSQTSHPTPTSEIPLVEEEPRQQHVQRRVSQQDMDEYNQYINSMNNNNNNSTSNLNIVGGSNTNTFYPWFVHFASKVCAGTLISPTRVLTSATCLQQTGVPAFVRVGATNSMNGVLAGVACAKTHPDYQMTAGRQTILHDVAILKLKTQVNDKTPVRLNVNQNYPSSGSNKLTALGMGVSNQLRRLDMDFVSTANCQSDYNSNSIIRGDGIHLCGQARDRGMCLGDSGSPLMDDDANTALQVGITSFTYGDCGDRDIPDVFAPVATYYEWIQSQLQDNTCDGDTLAPTSMPSSIPSSIPSSMPSISSAPSPAPTTQLPTISSQPSLSNQPSTCPSVSPHPSSMPTSTPTKVPTAAPTPIPTPVPTTAPTVAPTVGPTSVLDGIAAKRTFAWLTNEESWFRELLARKKQWVRQHIFHQDN